jgi:hypothetical protein
MTDIPERRFLPADVIVPPVPEHMIDRGVFPAWADGWTEGYIARQQEVERLNGLRRSSRASRKRYKRDNADLLLRLAERDEQLAASQQANAAMANESSRWRQRYIGELVTHYQTARCLPYEEARAEAEYEANEREEAFHAAVAARDAAITEQANG